MRNIKNLDPNHCAVVIVDLQKGFCDPNSDAATKLGWDVGPAEEICKRSVGFLEEVRKYLHPAKIIWVRMDEQPNTIAKNMHYAPHKKGSFDRLCARGTPGHEFHIVKPAKGEPVFLKFNMSAFSSPPFRKYLEKTKVKQLAVIGVLASRCVNATIIVGSSLGYEVAAITDLIGGPKNLAAELRHHTKVTNFFYACPVTAKDFVKELRRKSAGLKLG